MSLADVRLTTREKDGIREAVETASVKFGASWKRISLFGSRVDPAKFPDSDRRRVDQLSEKARAGKLSAAEQHELDEYLAIESALISLKSKARLALKST